MKVVLIGSNGFLAKQIGKFCNEFKFELIVYGKSIPTEYQFIEYIEIDLLNNLPGIEKLLFSSVIIYAVGGGIQFHLKEFSNNIYKLNLQIPIILYRSLQENNYKGTFVSFGSYFEIGENNEFRKFTEIEIIKNQAHLPNDYSISKFMLTNFIHRTSPNLKYYHFILPTIYGESESRLRLIPYTIDSIINNKTLELTSGEQIREYIYINNVVEIVFECLINRIPSDIYNIPPTETYSVKDLVAKIYKFMNADLPIGIFGLSKRVDEKMKILQIDGTKLRNEIKSYSGMQIEDILNKYFKNND